QNPSILILDEATASVDPFTETKIQEAMEKAMEGRTTIVIAHRLVTVRHVDRIIVLDDGKIMEEGNHKELMKKGGYYSKLYDTYFKHQSYEFLEEHQPSRIKDTGT
ncbi:MAG: ABC transporter ATP-binding protein, partial [Promethearchaeota archaeon]